MKNKKWIAVLIVAILVIARLSGMELPLHWNTKAEVAANNSNRSYYEIFVYSFYDSNGDGIGDLNGVTEKLDYINDGKPGTDTDLGCNGLWLMPIMPSTTYHKYDITDYKNIDPEYGTLEDFQKLVTACHERGINVIIDLVMNHSSSKHPWFQAASEYLRNLEPGKEPDFNECPYVWYYNFSHDRPAGYQPLPGTDNWFYEAQFWGEMPDFNLYTDALRGEFADIIQFWLDLGVDGFRLDAAKEYVTGNTEANVAILSWFNDMVKSKKEDAYIVAEVWNDMDTYGRYYSSGINSCFDFAFATNSGVIANVLNKAYPAVGYGNAIVNLQNTLNSYSGSWADAPFYTNHDTARGAGYFSGDNSERQAKVAQAMNLLMSGNAFLYYGEELGMKGSGKDENKRAPMYWTMDSQAAGMCRGPEGMDSIKMKYGSLEEQEKDENSIYQFVKKAIWIRNHYESISSGRAEVIGSLSGDDICAIRKVGREEETVLLFNCSDQLQYVRMEDGALSGKKIAEQLITGTEAAEVKDGQIVVPAYSAVVLQ